MSIRLDITTEAHDIIERAHNYAHDSFSSDEVRELRRNLESLQRRNDTQAQSISSYHAAEEKWALERAAMTEERDLLRARIPRAYIMTRKSEWLRMFREVRGFLNACRAEHHGTDFSGRMHAINALDAAVEFLNGEERTQAVNDAAQEPRE